MIILKFVILQFIAKIEVVIGLLDITSTTLEVTADLEESENDEDGLAEAASKEGGSSSRRPRYTFSSSLGICGAWDPLKVGLEALSPPFSTSSSSSYTSFAALLLLLAPNITTEAAEAAGLLLSTFETLGVYSTMYTTTSTRWYCATLYYYVVPIYTIHILPIVWMK